MDESMMETVKEYLTCRELTSSNVIKYEFINEISPYIYLELGDSFIYVDEYSNEDFLILEYLDKKEKELKKGFYNKNESKASLKNLMDFKNEVYKVLEKDEYYQVLFIKIAI